MSRTVSCPAAAWPSKTASKSFPVINRIAKGFANVVMTQDWHPPGHISFASVHAGKKPFETVDLAYSKQVLWPDHCVQGTDGAALSKDLSIPQAALVIRKGFHKDVDSYSAFTEADGKATTGLAAYLKARQIERLFVAGLATDFCVAWTALDARKAEFETYVVEEPAAASIRRARSPKPGATWPTAASSASGQMILRSRPILAALSHHRLRY